MPDVPWTIVFYVLSAGLEFAGIVVVVLDVRDDVVIVRRLAATQKRAERAMSVVPYHAAMIDHVLAALSAKGWRRRLLGPVLIGLGVAVGLAANLAAL